ncbi:MAG: S41 family peptidase [Phycisphaerae bacterium]|nr:S41 family peptidase [Phycisphaerae bacterium]
MLTRVALKRLAAFWVTASVALGATVLSAAPPDLQLTSATAKELWRKGSDQILAGDFDGAITTLERVQAIEPDRSEVTAAITWMRDARELDESRERLRLRYYEHYTEEALKAAKEAKEAAEVVPEGGGQDADEKDNVKKQEGAERRAVPVGRQESEDGNLDEDEEDESDPAYKWGTALRYAHAAMTNAKDKDAFRAQPWLNEIVGHVLLETERHKGLNEWRDALVLYDLLKEVYPDNKEYEDGYDFCRKRAHLDFIYGSKSTWRADLRGVTPDVIGEILLQIDDKYVKEVDFKDLCLHGLEQLLILGKAQTLTDTFPTLGDEDLVAHFVTRLENFVRKAQRAHSGFKVQDVVRTFRDVLRVNEHSLRLPECVLVDEFVAGLLEPLDEFTAVVWPAEIPEFDKHTRGAFPGVGIQITKDDEKPIRVESPLENSPAYRAGIKPGDLITAVDGKSILELTIVQAVRLITGEPGTTVTLTIMDPVTEETREIPLKREKIEIHTVGGCYRDESKPTGWDFFIDPENKISYVRVSGFMDKTVSDLESAIEQIHNEGCQGLILDLRFNPGGLLTSARDMCEVFLDEDDPIVKTKGRTREDNTEIRCRSRRGRSDMPLIVLVNEYSASASEIVAGALAGEKEACIVGERTFGKGSVQRLIPIADNHAYLKLTTAHYYIYDMDLPRDDPWYCLHKLSGADNWGVEPHVGVEVIPQETNKILRIRRERDLLKGKDQAEIPQEVLERTATTQPSPHLQEDEDPDTDPQIVVALNLMRIKLLSDQPWALAPRHERTLTHARANIIRDEKPGSSN